MRFGAHVRLTLVDLLAGSTASQPLGKQIKFDVAATGVDIRLYRSIESFLAANALHEKPVGADWALDIFRRAT
jgi:hypothetical protein